MMCMQRNLKYLLIKLFFYYFEIFFYENILQICKNKKILQKILSLRGAGLLIKSHKSLDKT